MDAMALPVIYPRQSDDFRNTALLCHHCTLSPFEVLKRFAGALPASAPSSCNSLLQITIECNGAPKSASAFHLWYQPQSAILPPDPCQPDTLRLVGLDDPLPPYPLTIEAAIMPG